MASAFSVRSTKLSVNEHSILFYDGLCGLCDLWVQFVLARDKRRRIHYAALQGKTAGRLLDQHLITTMPSVVFHHQGRNLLKSRAILAVLRQLGGPWHLFVVFYLVPRFIADFVYDGVARRRLLWFGRLAACRRPDAEDRELFLD